MPRHVAPPNYEIFTLSDEPTDCVVVFTISQEYILLPRAKGKCDMYSYTRCMVLTKTNLDLLARGLPRSASVTRISVEF